MTIQDAHLQFTSLSPLSFNAIDTIVVHHAAMDGSVQDIHRVHKQMGWSGIGYHLYIRKDGSIWKGRPLNTLGAHVKGHNSHTIGICLEGNYVNEVPSSTILSSLSFAIQYVRQVVGKNLPVKGHRDLMATACPGRNITAAILQKASKGEYLNNMETKVPPIKSTNDILWELSHQGIITDINLWKTKMENDLDIYWLCRKVANKMSGTPED